MTPRPADPCQKSPRAPARIKPPKARTDVAMRHWIGLTPRGAPKRGNQRATHAHGQWRRSSRQRFFCTEPGLNAEIIPAAKPDPNQLEVELTIAADARVGLHRFGVVTPLGVPPYQVFGVEAEAEASEVEPNDDPSQVKPVASQATLVGTIDRPGDVDHFRFQVKKGEQLVFGLTARSLGSTLQGGLALLDETGRTIAESAADGRRGTRVSHRENRARRTRDAPGSGRRLRRLRGPFLSDRGWSRSPSHRRYSRSACLRGGTSLLHVEGLNLDTSSEIQLPVAAGTPPGRLVAVPLHPQAA